MRVVPLAEAKGALSAYVDASQKDRILVTRHGKPAALIIGVQGEAIEDLLTRSDSGFWRMIEARRREPTVSARDIRKELGLPKRGSSKGRSRRRH
jgi:prevent-host-death family protein